MNRLARYIFSVLTGYYLLLPDVSLAEISLTDLKNEEIKQVFFQIEEAYWPVSKDYSEQEDWAITFSKNGTWEGGLTDIQADGYGKWIVKDNKVCLTLDGGRTDWSEPAVGCVRVSVNLEDKFVYLSGKHLNATPFKFAQIPDNLKSTQTGRTGVQKKIQANIKSSGSTNADERIVVLNNKEINLIFSKLSNVEWPTDEAGAYVSFILDITDTGSWEGRLSDGRFEMWGKWRAEEGKLCLTLDGGETDWVSPFVGCVPIKVDRNNSHILAEFSSLDKNNYLLTDEKISELESIIGNKTQKTKSAELARIQEEENRRLELERQKEDERRRVNAARKMAEKEKKEMLAEKKRKEKLAEKIRNNVLSVQKSLTALGFYSHKVDGILNPRLLSAILSWGKDSGFAFDGNISPALVSILELKASDAEMTKKKAILAKQKEAQKQKEELARKEAAIKRKAEIARKKAQADVARKKLEAEIARKKAEEKRKKELIRKKAEEQRKAKKEKRRLVTQAKNLRKDLLKQRNQLGGLLKDAQKYFKVAEKTPTTLKLMRKVLGAGKVYSAPPPKVISEKAKIGFIKGYISSNTKTIVKYKEAYNLLKENKAFQKFHIKQNAIRKKEIEGQRLVYSANLAYAVEFLFDYISKNMDSKNSEKVLDMIDRLEKEKVEKDLKTLINHNTVLAKELKSLDLTNAYLQFVDAKTKANLAKKKSVKKKPIKKATKVRKTSKQKASKKTKSSEKSSSKPLKKVTRRSAGSGSAKPCEYEYNFNRVFYASQKNYKDFKRTGEAFESYITRADEVGSMFISGKGVCKSKKDDGRNLNKAAEEYRRAIEMGSSLNPKPVPVQKAIKQVKLKACGLSSSLSEEAKILVDEGNHKEAVATYMTAYTKFGNKDAKASLKKYCKKARKNKKLLKVLSKPVVRKSCRAGKGKIQPALRTAEWKKLDGRTPFCP